MSISDAENYYYTDKKNLEYIIENKYMPFPKINCIDPYRTNDRFDIYDYERVRLQIPEVSVSTEVQEVSGALAYGSTSSRVVAKGREVPTRPKLPEVQKLPVDSEGMVRRKISVD